MARRVDALESSALLGSAASPINRVELSGANAAVEKKGRAAPWPILAVSCRKD